MDENAISYRIIGAVFQVYNTLGPGLLESVYQKVLLYELKKQGLYAEAEVHIPIIYDYLSFGDELKADIVVEHKVIIELKSVAEIRDIHYKQLLTYLKLTKMKLGLLINFNSSNIREDIHRVVNKL